MVCYGYLRVSTTQQEINNNKAEILLLANNKNLGNVNWIQETVSGKKDWRNRILGSEFEKMKSGDTIIMSEYSRIGRDFLQSMEFLAECKRKSIDVYTTIGDIKLDDTPTSNLLLAITAWKNQVEREHLSYRTKIGMKAHKDKGSILGRKKIMNLERNETNKQKIKDMIDKDMKMKTIAKELKITTTTLRKFIKKYNLK
jgi:DNA invertase Pin-like site-specific DNA recombinase